MHPPIYRQQKVAHVRHPDDDISRFQLSTHTKVSRHVPHDEHLLIRIKMSIIHRNTVSKHHVTHDVERGRGGVARAGEWGLELKVKGLGQGAMYNVQTIVDLRGENVFNERVIVVAAEEEGGKAVKKVGKEEEESGNEKQEGGKEELSGNVADITLVFVPLPCSSVTQGVGGNEGEEGGGKQEWEFFIQVGVFDTHSLLSGDDTFLTRASSRHVVLVADMSCGDNARVRKRVEEAAADAAYVHQNTRLYAEIDEPRLPLSEEEEGGGADNSLSTGLNMELHGENHPAVVIKNCRLVYKGNAGAFWVKMYT